MIRQKVGQCVDCPEGSPDQPITAGRCNKHYWPHRAKVSASKVRVKEKGVYKDELNIFFADETANMPECCEECGNRLPKSPAWMRRACIAHILPKRVEHGFPSVATHTLNKMFFCPDCHTNMDNLGKDRILKMKTLPIMRERVAQLIPLLTPDELRRVPEYFLTA